MKVVILSDTHLVASGETSRSLDTGERLHQAIIDINTHHADATLCVLSGDLADHGQREAYLRLQNLLAELTVPWRLMIGNHDHRETFLGVFKDTPVDDSGFVQSVYDSPEGRLIFLDSVDAGEDDGVLCEARLNWFRTRLAEAETQPVYVFLHHPPCDIGMGVDRVKLRNPDALLGALRQHTDVRSVFAGHAHHPTSVMWHRHPCYVVGATHYNATLHLTGTPGVGMRCYGPAYYAVVLIDGDYLAVHHHDFLYGYPELARPLFQRIHQDFGLESAPTPVS